MESRKLRKSVSQCHSVTDPARGGHAVPQVLSAEIVQGIYRYTRIAGAVYSVYRETTKKYIGLSLYDGKEFNECGADVLVQALQHESKNGKG